MAERNPWNDFKFYFILSEQVDIFRCPKISPIVRDIISLGGYIELRNFREANIVVTDLKERDDVYGAPSARTLLQDAIKSGISVWSLETTIDLIKQLRKPKTRVLQRPAIKLEDEANPTRPDFKELKAWPDLTYDGRPGSSPFSTSSSSKHKIFMETWKYLPSLKFTNR